jgi:cysteine desulfurase / selenocysteine lyase
MARVLLWPEPAAEGWPVSRIHLNNAGAGTLSPATIGAIVDHLRLEREAGGHEAAELASDRISQLRAQIADLAGFRAEEVSLVDSATRAWNTLVYGLSLSVGDIVVVSQLDYGSGLASLVHHLGRQGVRLHVAPTDAVGRVDPERLRRNWPPTARLIAISHAPAHLPLLNPIAEIAGIARDVGVPMVIDAAQSLGAVSFHELTGDAVAVCGTGRKWLRGPRGTGFLAARAGWRSLTNPPTAELSNTSAERLATTNLADIMLVDGPGRFELWEKNVAALIGLSTAMTEVADADVAATSGKLKKKAGNFKELLSPAARRLLVVPEVQETGVVSLALPRADGVKSFFSDRGVNIAVLGRWAAPLDFDKRGLNHVLRASPHTETSDEDLERGATIVNEYVSTLSG